jgi:hypothetical protein
MQNLQAKSAMKDGKPPDTILILQTPTDQLLTPHLRPCAALRRFEPV